MWKLSFSKRAIPDSSSEAKRPRSLLTKPVVIVALLLFIVAGTGASGIFAFGGCIVCDPSPRAEPWQATPLVPADAVRDPKDAEKKQP